MWAQAAPGSYLFCAVLTAQVRTAGGPNITAKPGTDSHPFQHYATVRLY